MDKLFKFDVHQGEDYFSFSELNTTNDEVKYSTQTDLATGKLILKQLEVLKSFIRAI